MIDTMGGLGKKDVYEVKKRITDLGYFEKLLIIDWEGNLFLEQINSIPNRFHI